MYAVFDFHNLLIHAFQYPCAVFSTSQEWLELQALRCEEQLRDVVDFIRSFGSGDGPRVSYGAAPEQVLELYLALWKRWMVVLGLGPNVQNWG